MSLLSNKLRVLPALAALLLTAQFASAQTTVAVSGHAQIPDASAQTKATVRFELAGCSNGQAKVDGVTIFSDYRKDFPVDPTTGAITGVIYPNVASPVNNSIDCNGQYGTTKFLVTPYVNGRPNGIGVLCTVGPGAFNLDSANCDQNPPPIVVGVPGDISWNVENPTAADNGKFQHKLSRAGTAVRLSCDTDSGTVSINFEVRGESTPNSAASSQVLSSPLVCGTTNAVTTTFAAPVIAANSPLALDISATSGSPTIVRVHLSLE